MFSKVLAVLLQLAARDNIGMPTIFSSSDLAERLSDSIVSY